MTEADAALRSPEDYELYLYSLMERHATVRRSTLVLIRRGSTLARVTGEVRFGDEVRLVVRERLSFDRTPGKIDGYGYEVWKGTEKLYWYDSQPHPNEPTLASTHPHHKHVPPDIKHNRVPAPGFAFDRPNLRLLIEEIEKLLSTSS